MKYSENTIPKTPGQLRDAMVFTQTHAGSGVFPDWSGLDFDGAFQRLFRGVEDLRKRFGNAKADQLVDMLRQAIAHYQAGDRKLGSWLMQDAEEIIYDRQPFAYPKERYRWPIDPNAPEITREDLLREAEEE